MNRREQFKRNLSLQKTFFKQLFEHPEYFDSIPQGSEVIFLPDDDPELYKANLALAERVKSEGKRVTLVHGCKDFRATIPIGPSLELVVSLLEYSSPYTVYRPAAAGTGIPKLFAVVTCHEAVLTDASSA